MGHKRKGGFTAGPGKTYTGNMIASKGNKSAYDGPTPAGKGPGTGRMGVGVGKAGKMTQGGDPGGVAAGRARTNRGKNSTGAGPQGFRG